MLYVRNIQTSNRERLEIKKISNVTEYRADIHISIAILYTTNKHMEKWTPFPLQWP